MHSAIPCDWELRETISLHVVHLPNIPQEKIFKKVDSFIKIFKKVDSFILYLRNISFRGLNACLLVLMVLPPWFEPKRFHEFMKNLKNKFLELFSSSPRKNLAATEIWEDLRLVLKYISFAVNHIMCRHWRIRWFGTFYDEMVAEHGRLFIWTSVDSWGKMLKRVAHALPPVHYWKSRIITLLNDWTTGIGFPHSYS